MFQENHTSCGSTSTYLQKDFWVQVLQQDILPFWHDAIDRTYGGVFTCFSNDGEELLSPNKYIWSQGRFLWLMCKQLAMIDQGVMSSPYTQLYKESAQKTAEFLMRHAFEDSGNCRFLVDQKGSPIEEIPGKGYDTSIFADCFVALGLSEYASYFLDEEMLNIALDCYQNIVQRVASGNFRSEPYKKPEGFDLHSYSMIVLNISCNVFHALSRFQRPASEIEKVKQQISKHYQAILYKFHQPDITKSHRIIEALPIDKNDQDTVLFRHVNPGHALECCWFLYEAMGILGQNDVDAIAEIAQAAWNAGWDNIHGGLLRFVDADAKTAPQGKVRGSAFEKLILDTWDTKLWWPHSEALYTFLLLYCETKNSNFLRLHESVAAYCFSTFPHPHNKEWIQIRDRLGNPLQKVVALPVKDPFHIARNIMLIIELLDKSTKHD